MKKFVMEIDCDDVGKSREEVVMDAFKDITGQLERRCYEYSDVWNDKEIIGYWKFQKEFGT